MQTRLIFSDSKSNIDIFRKKFNKKYNEIDQLFQEIQRERCNDPEKVDDYMIWQTLINLEREMESSSEQNSDLTNKGLLQIREEILYYSSDFYSILTPRRIELLEYIHNKNPKSVKSLAEETNRDYKNVYDDLIALEKYNLLEFTREGKNKRPVSRLTMIDVVLSK